ARPRSTVAWYLTGPNRCLMAVRIPNRAAYRNRKFRSECGPLEKPCFTLTVTDIDEDAAGKTATEPRGRHFQQTGVGPDVAWNAQNQELVKHVVSKYGHFAFWINMRPSNR